MRDGFIHIARGYMAATQEKFAGHPMAAFLRVEMPERVRALIGDVAMTYRIEGSAGLGRWSNSPWIAVLDPLVTDSAMRGYYPVYLFSPGFDRVSLVLGQGTYSVRAEFGARGAEILKERGEIIRTRVPEYRGRFSAGPFPIVSSAHAGQDWSTASVFGRTYEIANIPTNDELVDDLKALLRFYNIATARGGYVLSADDEHDVGPPPRDQAARREWEEGEKRLRQHESVERRRNSSLVKRVKEVQGFTCRGCGFRFDLIYGRVGAEFIEAHHLVPLADLTEDGPVARDPETDFAVLCANCHRMIHQLKCPSLDEFKKAINAAYVKALAHLHG